MCHAESRCTWCKPVDDSEMNSPLRNGANRGATSETEREAFLTGEDSQALTAVGPPTL